MTSRYLDDDACGFTVCDDCQTTTGEHLHGCPSDPLASEITPDEADRLRAEHEAAEQAKEQAKAERKAAERAQWNAAVRIAQRRVAERCAEELASDVAWARSVLVEGETFLDGSRLYAALSLTKKASVGRSLGLSEIARLRRVVAALTPELVAQDSDHALTGRVPVGQPMGAA